MKEKYNTWVDVNASWIKPNTLQVSPEGKVLDDRGVHNPTYLSSNGYMYEFVMSPDGQVTLMPFDVIMAMAFVPYKEELNGKEIKVIHKNGILSDCHYQNLDWAEDIEEWRDIEYKDIKRGYYQISNFGRVRSITSDSPKIMKTDTSGKYDRITLSTYGHVRGLNYSIHRLVAWHFVLGWSIDKDCVNHIDSNAKHNYYVNLEWVSVSQNTKHAYDTGLIGKGDNSPVSKISEKDAIKICNVLNKYGGSIINTYKELSNSIPGLTYPIVSSIKYGETFTYISDKILTSSGRKKCIRQTDPDVIIEAARCLKKYNGDVKKTKKEFEIDHPWVSYGWLWHLKDKSVASEITDMVFTKDEFPKGTALTEDDVMMIIDSLLKHKGDAYVSQTVFDELKDKIEGLTKDKVRGIKDKKAWKILSDKYFSKGDI